MRRSWSRLPRTRSPQLTRSGLLGSLDHLGVLPSALSSPVLAISINTRLGRTPTPPRGPRRTSRSRAGRPASSSYRLPPRRRSARRRCRRGAPSTGSTPSSACPPTNAAAAAARPSATAKPPWPWGCGWPSTTHGRTTPTRSSGRPARTTAPPTPSKPPATNPPAPATALSGSASHANHARARSRTDGSGQPHHHRRQPGRGPRAALYQQRHCRREHAGGRDPAGPAGRRVARRRHLLPQGECLARAGRAPGRLAFQGGPGDGHRSAAPAELGDPEGDKRSVTEIEADEVGASLKWAAAKVERTQQRGNGDRSNGRERAAERGGDFDEAPP